MHLGPTGRGLALTAVLTLGTLVMLPASTPGVDLLVRVTDSQPGWTSSYFYQGFQACPKDHVVVGGGARILEGNGQVRLTGSAPVMGSRHGYDARAEEVGGAYAGQWALDVFAVCAPENTISGYLGVPIRRRTDWSPAGDKRVDVPCPDGKQVIGTGAWIDHVPAGERDVGHLGLWPADQSPTIAHAAARADVDNYAGTWRLTAIAVCADHSLVPSR